MAADHNPLIQNDIPRVRGWEFLIFAAAMALLVVPALWLAGGRGMLAALTAFFGAGLAAVLIATLSMGWSALPALGFRPVGWRPIVLGTLATALLSVAVSQLGIEPQGMKQAVEIARRPAQLLVALAVLAGLAPLVEELVFRGLLYGWLAGRWGTIVAWLVSSLAFAAAHAEPAHIILVLPLGLWFGWLRRRTDSIWPSLVAHMANNALAVTAAALLDG